MCCCIISLVADTWKHYRSRCKKLAIITLSKKPSCDIEMRDISEETPTVKSDANVVDVKSSDDNKTKTTPFGRYELRDIEAATKGFANTNVIGAGDYGDVFRGLFKDTNSTQVVVKKLYLRDSNMEQGFGREAEAMLMVKHRNLVKLLGYHHVEGSNRMLVSEYVDNGNLNYWLHHYKDSHVSPLTWDIRMKIIIGIAKGLSYLHEDIEPAIVHQNLKSSNVLLDQQWNPKISDFGIPKLLGIRWDIYTSPPNGMSGYIAPEYRRTRVLDESSDVYSFGILMMEIISGRTSTETLHEIEENLVDRIKSLTREGKYGLIPDPKLPEPPSKSKLRRIVHIALCCVDPIIRNRPNMGQIVQMLEPRVFERLSDVKEVKNKSYWFNWRNS